MISVTVRQQRVALRLLLGSLHVLTPNSFYKDFALIVMSLCLIFRVLRQIFQSLKQIADVILLLLFVIAFFALIGKL